MRLAIALGLLLLTGASPPSLAPLVPDQAWLKAFNQCLDSGKMIVRPPNWIQQGHQGWACEGIAGIITRYCDSIEGELYLDTENQLYCGIGPKTAPRAK